MIVVSQPPADRSRAFFGAWVTVVDRSGVRRRHRIVGPDEFDQGAGYISMDSPLGRALLGKCVGDELEIELPTGATRVTVTAIVYPPADGGGAATGDS
jgi:transcription elongation factor GreB